MPGPDVLEPVRNRCREVVDRATFVRMSDLFEHASQQ